MIYRLTERTVDNCKEVIIIHIPIADKEGEFSMCLGTPTNPGRRSETKLEILSYGSYLGKPVTKVRLYPITGRRHQLRVHLLSLGHPIVGDATYNTNYDERSSRMMLHAHKLSINLGDKYTPSFVEADTVDPFPMVGGCLQPILPSYVIGRENH